MKQALCLLIALAVPTLSVQGASESFKSKIGSSKLTIFGDSTVHKWKVETRFIGGFLKIDTAKLGAAGGADVTRKVIIPVRQLKSANKRLDEVMHAAMNATTHKFISFDLTGLKVKSVKDGVATCTGTGTLKINGKSKAITLPVTITSKGGQLEVAGSTPVNMKSDFGIEPPSPKLPTGKITTKEAVKIEFNWIVAK